MSGSVSGGGGGGGSVDSESEEMVLADIKEPNDADVLCGRGGAALRHPGNQTYRRLVNLNKGLYITCLKTEKLKISRSIVAAIREQKGRFLEKDKSDSWYDIGDKKAIEKTSQALREGQPKLRQKIVEMGGGAAGTAAYMESHYGHPGIYSPEQVGLTSSNGMDNAIMPPPDNHHHGHMGGHPHQQQQLHQNHMGHHQHSQLRQGMGGLRTQEMQAMQPSMQQPQHGGGGGRRPDLQSDMLQRLSLTDATTSSDEQRNIHYLQQRSRLRPSLEQRASVALELGIDESSLSLLSEFSAFGQSQLMASMRGSGSGGQIHPMDSTSYRQHGTNGMNPSSGQYGMDQFGSDNSSGDMGMSSGGGGGSSSMHSSSYHNHFNQQQQQAGGPLQHLPGSGGVGGLDRRRVFAKMKYNRPPSTKAAPTKMTSSGHLAVASQHSVGDGMPDIHMVESNLSLYSNLSNMSGLESRHTLGDMKPFAMGSLSTGLGDSHHQQQQQHYPYHQQQQHRIIVETAKVIDHSSRPSALPDAMGSGSRHSIMSGLSRISDTSIDNSIFSDLSKKIGDVSTRSMAMSEISAIDLAEQENEEDEEEDDDEQSQAEASEHEHPLAIIGGRRKAELGYDL